ncbi:DYW domain [Phytophthora cactorum]|nr:DYW domain [Phytophthora cactorum]
MELQPPPAAAAPRYFTFKDFLAEAEAATFFELPHAEQVVKVTQPAPDSAQFTTSSKASISFAKLRGDCDAAADDDADQDASFELDAVHWTNYWKDGHARLSLAVAHTVEKIDHTYIVERNKRGVVKPPVLNSRSFFFYWCHAEKQKLMDIQEKLAAKGMPPERRLLYWQRIVIIVDRAMCDDCIQFADCFARFEKAFICIQDPESCASFSFIQHSATPSYPS